MSVTIADDRCAGKNRNTAMTVPEEYSKSKVRIGKEHRFPVISRGRLYFCIRMKQKNDVSF